MKKFFALLLCAAMLLSLAACGGDKPADNPAASQPVSTPEPTPEPTPDPLETALKSYEDGIAALLAQNDLQFDISRSITRTLGGESYEEKLDETLIYKNRFSDTPLIYRDQLWNYFGQDTYSEYLYSDGTVFIDGLYKSEISKADFEATLYPIQLIDPALYGEVSLDGSSLVFSAPSAAEAWLGDAELINATARAELAADGSIVGMSYEAEYLQNAVAVSFTLSVSPAEVEEDISGRVPTALSTYKDVPDMRIPELFNRASIAVRNGDSQNFSYTTTVEIDVLGFEYSEIGQTFISGSGSDMSVQQDIIIDWSQGWTEESSYYSANYHDGVIRAAQDGQLYEQPVPVSGLDMDTIFYSDMISFRNLSDFELSYPDGYILIDFQVSPGLGTKTQEDICSELFDWPERLDDMATGFNTLSYFGHLAFDADTMLPTAYYTEFEGAHVIYGNNREIKRCSSAAFDMLSSAAEEYATGTAPEEPEPETPATPLFYKVSGENGQVMWLLGTIHIGDERTAHLPESIYRAFDQSDALALEIDEESVARYLDRNAGFERTLEDKTHYLGSFSIHDNIDPQLYEDALKLIKAVGGYSADIDTWRPNLWSGVIENAFMLHVGELSSQYGVENRLTKLAKDKGIEIRSIEDIRKHLTVLYNFSEELQFLLLSDLVYYGRGEYISDTNELYEQWCAGDEESLRELIRLQSELEFTDEELAQLSPEEIAAIEACVAEYNQAISTDRDADMIAKAIEYLESGETVFYAVGLAHLLAETGLVDGLRAAGYTVELVK